MVGRRSVRPPLADWEQFADISFRRRRSRSTSTRHSARTFSPWPAAGNRDWYALYGWFDLFERMQFLRGTENLLMDIADDQPRLHELADRIVERNLAMIARYIAQGVDGVFFGDDWGTQTGLAHQPAAVAGVLQTPLPRMFKPLQDAGRHIFFHSCGYTVDLWDDLIELGVNVLNVQHSIIPRPVLEEKLAGKICICSDPSRQQVMPFGSPEEVKRHIREIVDIFASPNGGLIQRGELSPDWPLANAGRCWRLLPNPSLRA